MNCISLKKKVLEESKKHQQETIDNLRESIERYKEGDVKVADQEIDLQEQSNSEFTYEVINRLADNLNTANDGLDTLNKIRVVDEHKEVDFGALVLTDKQNFMVAVGMEPFEVEGVKVIGISEKSILYSKMKGLHKGEGFDHNGTHYEIKDVA